MKCLVILSLLVVAAAANFKFAEEWDLWKAQHGKSFQSEREELERHIIWLSNKAYIEAHNSNSLIFGSTLAMNQFGDMDDSEYTAFLGSRVNTRNIAKAQHKMITVPQENYPEYVDWRSKNAVADVKDQGTRCSAGYAFSAMGALESAWALSNRTLMPLSEQNIIDCSVPYGNRGCSGGSIFAAFLYVIANEGVNSQYSYPYLGRQRSCKYDSSNVSAQMTGMVGLEGGSEIDLMAAVATLGPVSVVVDASTKMFRYYSSGVFDCSLCSSSYLNHPMLVIGYGSTEGQNYWLVKNSWGTNWGMNGYIYMTRNKYNQCGIASEATYVML